MAILTPVVMEIRGLVFHPLFWMVLLNGLYFVCLCMMVCSGNLSWPYVDSMNYIVWLDDGEMCGLSLGALARYLVVCALE
jgi:hypothetical protein